MNLASLSASYLRARPLQTLLGLLLLALGVATIVLLVLVVTQLEERMNRDARGIDLVVGAKGSAMQLILSGIYHIDAPTGNIPLATAQELEKNQLIKKAMPLALGDGWKGYRIVGSRHDYIEHYRGKAVAGRLWQKPMEVVLGSEVAARTGVGVGARFAGAHGVTGQGEEHGAAPYDVVGILGATGSVIDRLVLTAIDSVWQVHEEEHGPMDEADRKAMEEDREVTVLLIQYASPLADSTLARDINSRPEMQAASPANETSRLFRIVGFGVEALRAFAFILIIAAGLSLFVALYTALEGRRYDLALMRTLGASPTRLFGLLIMEGMVLAALGALIGIALGHLLASALGAWLVTQQQYRVSGLQFLGEELWVLAIALAVGLLAAVIPAWRAYRTDVAGILARG
jgi:putative ABC transport system permease protein